MNNLPPEVTSFYQKENSPDYYQKYEMEHSNRLDWTIKYFGMDKWRNKAVLDVGCSTGYFLNQLNHNLNIDQLNYCVGIDGSNICESLPRYFRFYQKDLNQPFFEEEEFNADFDVVTCFETLEHIPNLYNCVSEIKRVAKIDADIYLSIPHIGMEHNSLYPSIFTERGFEEFLGQMALPIQQKIFCPESFGAWLYRVKNRPYSEKVLKFPKNDAKFIDASPLEVINT